MADPAGPDLLGRSLGKYRIHRKIGHGGMGVVYEAVHESIGQPVAIKVLLPMYSARPDIVSRFFNEARAVHIVQHPGLVRTLDFGQLADGTAYLVMEYLEGESLRERLVRSGERLSLSTTLRLSRQVASALRATHHVGIVHRDLKPDNVFLVPDPETTGGERAKVLDFGVAKIRAEGTAGETASGALLGTPLYMAPEQCRGAGGVTDRADVYSLGVMLYQLLAGRTPFVSTGTGELMIAHMTSEPPPLLQVAAEVPKGVAALVHWMLCKAPEQRPDMGQVEAELERLGAGRVQRVSAPSAGPSPGSPAVSTLGQAVGSVSQRSQGRRLQRWAAVVLVLVGTQIAVTRLMRTGTPAREVPVTREDVVSPRPPQPKTVECRVDSEPAGAQVLLGADHSVLGVTPWRTRRIEGSGGLALLLRKEGHAEQTLTLEPEGACQGQVRLLPLAAPQELLEDRRHAVDRKVRLLPRLPQETASSPPLPRPDQASERPTYKGTRPKILTEFPQ